MMKLEMALIMIVGITGCMTGSSDGYHQVVFRLVSSEVSPDQLDLIEVRLAELAREFGFQEIQAAEGIERRTFAKHAKTSAPPKFAGVEGASGLGLYLVIRSTGSQILLTQSRGREEVMFVGIMRDQIGGILQEVVGEDGYSVETRLWRGSYLA